MIIRKKIVEDLEEKDFISKLKSKNSEEKEVERSKENISSLDIIKMGKNQQI